MATLRSSLFGSVLVTTTVFAFAGCGSEPENPPQKNAGTGGSSSGAGGSSGKGGSAGAKSGKGGSGGRGGSAAAGEGGGAGDESQGGTANAGGEDNAAGEPGVGGSTQAGGSANAGGSAGSQAGEGGAAPIPECSPTDDPCPVGQYCGDAGECVAGCKNDDACASGRCGATHDCERCVTDQECAAGRVCGDGLCHEPCGTTEPSGCAVELDCCSSHCVSIDYDIAHCGGCGLGCTLGQFCGTAGCAAVTFANLCDVRSAVVVIDDLPGDTAPARALGNALAAHCVPAPAVVEVNEADATVINPATGQPLGGGDLLALAGGFFGQEAVRFLDGQRATPIYAAVGADGNYELRRASDDTTVVTFPPSELAPSHDYISIELGRDRVTGALAVIAYGFSEYGTAAAVWYLGNVILPDLTDREENWYVLEWTDDGDSTPNAGDAFTLIDSGP